MCEKSRTPDGDRQSDGWGVAWKEGNTWKTEKSLVPIWENTDRLLKIHQTYCLAVHVRSAGFDHQKGVIEYNQPYIKDGLCFVFNGMVRGVKLPYKLNGTIGAQKIFSFIQLLRKRQTLPKALDTARLMLLSHSREIEGMNIGIVHNNQFYILCEYDGNQEYFTIHYYQKDNLSIVCSEPILAYNWNNMRKGEILIL